MTFFAYFGRNPDQVASFSQARTSEEINGTLANTYFVYSRRGSNYTLRLEGVFFGPYLF